MTMHTTSTQRLLAMATGRQPADLVLANARIVDVFNQEIIHGHLAVGQGQILGIGEYQAQDRVDLEGRYLLPGLIDSHVHIESSMLSPRHFALCTVPRGTTTVIADPHEIANVLGLEGLDYMLDATANLPLTVYFMLPSCVPATPFEHAGAVLTAEDLTRFMDMDRILGLGEMMNVPGVLSGQEDVLAKQEATLSRGKLLDGHSPGLQGQELNAYAATGIRTDHECTTVSEMQDRIRRGMYVLIREGSAARNLQTLIQGLSPANARRCAMCTDDRHPEDILEQGHMDNHLRQAMRLGVSPLTAVSMATLNAAECYGLRGKGAVAPGFDADLCIVDDLEHFAVHQVYTQGRLVAQEGQAIGRFPAPSRGHPGNSVVLGQVQAKSFCLPLTTSRANVIRVQPQSLITRAEVRQVQADSSGCFQPALNPGLNLIAVLERHHGSGNIGLGLVENFCLGQGAMATTVAHDSHNMVVVGANIQDMVRAVRDLAHMGGGMTLCNHNEVLAHLPLPIAGLMRDAPARDTAGKLREMNRLARDTMGINPDLDPFMSLSFLALPVIPELKITDQGLFDVRSFSFIDVCTQTSATST